MPVGTPRAVLKGATPDLSWIQANIAVAEVDDKRGSPRGIETKGGGLRSVTLGSLNRVVAAGPPEGTEGPIRAIFNDLDGPEIIVGIARLADQTELVSDTVARRCVGIFIAFVGIVVPLDIREIVVGRPGQRPELAPADNACVESVLQGIGDAPVIDCLAIGVA